MMKKIIALLLAMCLGLGGVSALAEASRLEVRVSLDETNAPTVLQQLGLFSGESNQPDLCKSLAQLLKNFTMQLHMQEDATRVDFVFDGVTLLELSVLMGGENLVITSDLMDGAGLGLPMEYVTMLTDYGMANVIQNNDWLDLATRMLEAGLEVLGGAEVVRSSGSFSGDAYTGGATCTTIYLDDKIIAETLDAMMIRSARNTVTYLFGDEFLTEFTAMNAAAAEANAHSYILRIVRDEADVLVGVSLTVLQGDKQLATLSLGIGENDLRLVAGFPLDDVNYWHHSEVTWEVTEDPTGMETLRLTGSVEEFIAQKNYDFALGEMYRTQSMFYNTWNAQVNRQGSAYSWNMSLLERAGDSLVVDKTECQGLYLPDSRLSNTVTRSHSGKVWLTVSVNWATCEEMDAEGTGLVLYDLLTLDESTANDLVYGMAMDLAMRLLQVVPANLLVYLQ